MNHTKIVKEEMKKRTNNKGYLFALQFSVVYFMIGAFGILLWDYLVAHLFNNAITSYKEWFFLAFTSIIIFYIAWRFIYWDRTYITVLLKNRQKLQLFARVFEQLQEGLVITDENQRITNVNKAFEEITGFTEKDVLGKPLSSIKTGVEKKENFQQIWNTVNKEGSWSGEFINQKKNGRLYPEKLSLTKISNCHGNKTNFIGVFSDITEERNAKGKIDFLTYHDPITHLPRRALFLMITGKMLNSTYIKDERLVVMTIHLQHLDQAENSKKVSVFESIIKTIASRIQDVIPNGTIGRVGTKDFAIVWRELNEPEVEQHINELAQKVLETIQKPIVVDENDYFIYCTIGLALQNTDDNTAEQLYHNAIIARNKAQQKKKPYLIYNEKLQEQINYQLFLENELEKSIERAELEVNYQPKIDLKNGKVIGAEALIRWKHKDLNFVPPSQFIGLAEESGFIHKLGDWMLHQVSKDIKSWEEKGIHIPSVSLNLSPLQFGDADLPRKIESALRQYRVNPVKLEIEITESLNLFDIEKILDRIVGIKEIGVGLSIDDFGTGYSSLSYLHRIPADILKIDRSFIQDIPDNPSHVSLTKAIIAMAHELNLKVVAEGVETKEQEKFLKKLYCDYAQGYLYSKPLTKDAFEEWVLKENLLLEAH